MGGTPRVPWAEKMCPSTLSTALGHRNTTGTIITTLAEKCLPPHLYEHRMDVVHLHEERHLVDRKLAVHGKAFHCSQRLVVAHGDTGVEMDALGTGHWHFANDVIGRGYLQIRSHDTHMIDVVPPAQPRYLTLVT